jgi:hypothetical protein
MSPKLTHRKQLIKNKNNLSNFNYFRRDNYINITLKPSLKILWVKGIIKL